MADFALSKTANQTIADYENLSEISNTKFAMIADQESILDVSLTVLVTLSYQLVSRQHEM
jgi:hypothetical protein